MMYNENGFYPQDEYLNIPANMGIDKIGILTNIDILECLSSLELLKDKLVIITHGNYSRLIFQGEYIDPSAPLYSVARTLLLAINHGVFKYQFAQYLYRHCYNLLYLNCHPSYFINDLFVSGIFKWNELEIFFDVFGKSLPFRIERPSVFYKNKTTFYTRDYENIRRTVCRNDGTTYKESKGKHRSLLAIYNRGRKLDFRIPRYQSRAYHEAGNTDM